MDKLYDRPHAINWSFWGGNPFLALAEDKPAQEPTQPANGGNGGGQVTTGVIVSSCDNSAEKKADDTAAEDARRAYDETVQHGF